MVKIPERVCVDCDKIIKDKYRKPKNIYGLNLCKSCIMKRKVPWNKGLRWSLSYKEKLSALKKGKPSPKKGKKYGGEDIILYRKRYYKENKLRLSDYRKRYYQSTKDESIKYSIDWQRKNKDKHKKSAWRYNQTPKGKLSSKKQNTKRRREFGFCPLNEWFKNSDAHHINRTDVIFIPKEINESIPHNINNGQNIEVINTIAFFFLVQQNIKWLSEHFNETNQ